LAYHPATKVTAAQHDALRKSYTRFAEEVWPLVPDGPEKTIVMCHLQESLMYANLAVALQAPVDDQTADVARVLPTYTKNLAEEVPRT
jgi:hypothetical protein